YLRRFLQRRSSLTLPNLRPLVAALIRDSGIDPRKLEYPDAGISADRRRLGQLALDRLISDYMISYGLHARDAFELIDILRTCSVLSGDQPLRIAYLIPLIAGHLKGLPPGQF